MFKNIFCGESKKKIMKVFISHSNVQKTINVFDGQGKFWLEMQIMFNGSLTVHIFCFVWHKVEFIDNFISSVQIIFIENQSGMYDSVWYKQQFEMACADA